MPEENIVEINKFTARVGPWRRIDAVVFVHGIAGHFRDTWGAFPELLHSDPDLPDLDILLWGYRTSYLPQDVHGTGTLARNLVSELRVRLENAAGVSLALVAHSMGGLIVFEGLVEEMRHGRAEQKPTSLIRLISLFAVPTKGSWAADTADTVIERFALSEGFLNEQIRSLRGDACDSLIARVARQIYDPPDNGPNSRRIPIRMVVASRDTAVGVDDSDMANAPFQELPALELDYDHHDVKLPNSHEDIRYLALAHDIQSMVSERFAELCRRCLHGVGSDLTDAQTDLEIRYGAMLRKRFTDSVGRSEDEQYLYGVYRQLVLKDCASHGRPPFDSANRAIIVLRRSGSPNRGS